MAIIWQNSFDGPDGAAITVANSSTYGDALTDAVDSTYSSAWIATGTASALVGSMDVDTPGAPVADWSLRAYLMIPSGSYLTAWASTDYLWEIDDEFGTYEIGGISVAAHSADLIGQPIRIEISSVSGTATYRVWWTDVHSTGAADWEDSAASWDLEYIQFANGSGVGRPALDEVALAQGEWIGPAVQPQAETGAGDGRLDIRGEADGWAAGFAPAIGHLALLGTASGRAAQQGPGDGHLALRGSADGMAGASVATAPPVRDMWVGPLGRLHRMAERGDWERTPDLGIETHVSLHGQVTASRARWAPRSTALTWGRLLRVDADALHELALVHARADSTVCVIDPDATNLLTPEQSRGRPLAGAAPASTEDLYHLDGAGSITVGLISGERHACTQDAAAGDDVTWLHPYYGARGWPVMPGWPVYLNVALTEWAAPQDGRLWLTFRDWTGAVISSAAGLVGTGTCEADAPEGAATVTPHMVLASALSGLRVIGEASLSYVPPERGARPALGNGCPVYAVTGLGDVPNLPWRTTSLQLQEVRALAVR